jgi:hypothetical protein
MAEVIQLESFKRKQAAIRGFKTWLQRFSERLDEQTKLSDLSDKTLAFLISPGDQNIFVLYGLVMGVKDFGTVADFFDLDKADKMEVIAVSIYLLDHFRFECMRRLNWLLDDAEQPLPIVELIEQASRSRNKGRALVPQLCESHPKYHSYQELSDSERETFMRKQIPAAIEVFKNRVRDE